MSPRPTRRPSITFQGVRYGLAVDGYYKAEQTKLGNPEHWSLNRAIWAAAHGPIPSGWEVVFLDDDRTNLALDNLRAQPRSQKKRIRCAGSRPHVVFNGHRYYRCPDGYYQCARTVARRTGEYLLHRAVWADAHGPVSDGVHVHHRDEDRGNNDLSNLLAIDKHDHISEHKQGPQPHWTPEFRERAASLRRTEWAARQPRTIICAECGAAFQSTGMRAKFCTAQCRKRHAYHHSHGRRAERSVGAGL